MSRIEVPDLIGPTTQMPPLFPDGTTAASLVIEEHVPTYSGEHPTLVGRDSLQVPVIDLRASGLVPIDDDEDAMINAIAAVDEAQLSSEGLMPAAPVLPIDDASTDTTMKHQRSAGTSLGVAPLEPATTVRAPFVVDTPVPRRSPLGRMTPSSTPPLESALVAKPESSANLPRASSDENSRERTAMLALDPSSGMPRSGPWQAIVAVAKSLRSIRWWLRRRTSRVRPVRR